MIQGIFYARFLPQEGTKIVAQSPPGCIVPIPSLGGPTTKPPLFDFDVLQEYIIPRPAFFNRYVTVADPSGRYRVLGFPVSIAHARYDRNEFIFNFGLVVEADVDQIPYERVVRRLAVTFAEMEKQSGYLSTEGGGDQGGERSSRRPIESLLEIVKEDLNNYGECMIPVDDANTINMKLFPYHPDPAPVRGWHVPIPKMKLADVVDPTWDLTLQKIIPHIDGVSDVRRIAFQADVSTELTGLALRHLLRYDTILLLDLFFFNACYAPRPAVHEFIANVGGVLDECAAYVCVTPASVAASSAAASAAATSSGAAHDTTPAARDGGSSTMAGESTASTAGATSRRPVSNYDLIRLMTTLCVGRTILEWLRLHADAGFEVLRYVDVRRLVQFGVIKGYLYRVHKYVVSKQYLAAVATGQARPLGKGDVGSGDPLQKYTDGGHCFDQIITEQDLSDGEIVERLKSFNAPAGDLTVFYR